MGVTVDVWRACIGTFNKSSSPKKLLKASFISSTLNEEAVSLALISILLLIGCIELNPGPFHAKCDVCGVVLHSAANYGSHQAVHSKNKNFFFKCCSCDHICMTVGAFNTHYSRFHQNKDQSQGSCSAPDVFSDILVGVEYKCSEVVCQQVFRTVKELKTHMEGHLKNGFVIYCPFENCTNKFSKVTTFRTHYCQYHNKKNEGETINHSIDRNGCISFYDDNEDESSSSEAEEDRDNLEEESERDEDETYHDCEFNPRQNLPERDNLFPENFVRDYIGKFYLWMEGVLLIPSVKVQSICEEIALLCEMSHHRIKVALNAELLKAGMEKEKAEQIINAALKRDVIYSTHHKGMNVVDLTTEHMRSKFYKHRCSSVDFEEIPLGNNDAGKPKFAHRIPLKDTLLTMFADASIQKDIDDSFNHSGAPNIYQDITDGFVFKNHPICGNMKSIQLILFQDAFEFYPLSPSSGLYKCVGFYFMLGNMKPNHRSKVDAIQLAFLVKESDLKYFGTEDVLKSLLDELTELAESGIKYKDETLPVILTHLCGDNLGQHFIGGFLEGFTATYSCRFCEVSKQMIEKDPCCVLPFRTPEDYNNVLKQLNPDNPLDHKKGIKQNSVFNRIPFYHVSAPGQSVCSGHDILEGFGRKDYALYLRYFIEIKGWFTFEMLNRRIQSFKPQGRDAADSLVKLDPALKKIRGHASEIWLFIRMFPFLIGDKIEDENDKVWQLCLQLKTICEYVFSPAISECQVAKLKQLTELYVETRAKLFTRKLQPKHHYLLHYAELIQYFGPSIRLWTLRFESRHVFFKNAAKAGNNFKNITKTLIKKYVLNFAYKFTGHMIPSSLSFREKDLENIAYEKMKQEVVQLLESNPSYQQVLKSVEVDGIKYFPGMWTMLDSKGCHLVVGEIVLILFNGSSIKLILNAHHAENSFQGYYKIREEVIGFSAALITELKDYYPLCAYEFQGHLCLSLKHSNPSMDN